MQQQQQQQELQQWKAPDNQLFFPLSGIFFYHMSLSGRAIITVEERKLRRGYFEES
jgi:hypothetical protein